MCDLLFLVAGLFSKLPCSWTRISLLELPCLCPPRALAAHCSLCLSSGSRSSGPGFPITGNASGSNYGKCLRIHDFDSCSSKAGRMTQSSQLPAKAFNSFCSFWRLFHCFEGWPASRTKYIEETRNLKRFIPAVATSVLTTPPEKLR